MSNFTDYRDVFAAHDVSDVEQQDRAKRQASQSRRKVYGRDDAMGYHRRWIAGFHAGRMATLDPDAFLPVSAAAKRLDLTRQRTYVLIRKGQIPALRVGGGGPWLIPRAAIDELTGEVPGEDGCHLSATEPHPDE